MKRRTFLSGTAVSAAALALAGCGNDNAGGGSTESPAASTNLSLYASSPKDQYEPAVATFTADTGIKVEVVSAGTGELIKRIQAEGANPLGDVQWGGLGESVAAAMDSFAEFVSENDKDIIPEYSSAKVDNRMTSFSIIVNAFMINNKQAGDIKVESWEDLLNPALKGKIAFADPAKSSSALSQIINMLHAMGSEADPESGWDFVEQFARNLDGKILGSSSNVYQMVESGEYAVGITNETNAVKYVAAGADIRVTYPSEGNLVIADNVFLIKNARNADNGKKFINFLTSYEYQSGMEKVGLRTVRKDVTQSNFPALDTIPTLTQNEEWTKEFGSKVKDRWNDIFTSV